MTDIPKLAIIITHPIQYYSPLFNLINERDNIKIKVFYTWERGAGSFDQGFGKNVDWDIPLLKGYNFEFISNNGVKKRGFWDLKNPALNGSISKWGATHLLVFGWNYYSHLKAMRHFKGKIPVLFRGDSHLLNEKIGLKRFVRRITLNWIYKFIDTALFVGTNNKAYFLKHGLKANQLVFAPHAIDNDRFSGAKYQHLDEEVSNTRSKLGIKETDIVFSYIGKLEDVKQVDLLVEAFKNLKNRNIKLLIVGNGKNETEIKYASQTDNRILFMDFQNQSAMPAIYRIADFYVLPSKSETWGLAVNEAFACGRPAILSDKVGCAVDLIQEGETGFVFKSGSVVDLNDKLNQAIYSDHRVMGLKAFNLIQSWSFDSIANSLEQLCKNV
jgi:glycosyltransferase involved in cell wall biosynthesis